MAEQLILSLEEPTGDRSHRGDRGDRRDPGDEWRIDEQTREIGRRGLAEARRALAESGRRHDDAGSPREAHPAAA